MHWLRWLERGDLISSGMNLFIVVGGIADYSFLSGYFKWCLVYGFNLKMQPYFIKVILIKLFGRN